MGLLAGVGSCSWGGTSDRHLCCRHTDARTGAQDRPHGHRMPRPASLCAHAITIEVIGNGRVARARLSEVADPCEDGPLSFVGNKSGVLLDKATIRLARAGHVSVFCPPEPERPLADEG